MEWTWLSCLPPSPQFYSWSAWVRLWINARAHAHCPASFPFPCILIKRPRSLRRKTFIPGNEAATPWWEKNQNRGNMKPEIKETVNVHPFSILMQVLGYEPVTQSVSQISHGLRRKMILKIKLSLADSVWLCHPQSTLPGPGVRTLTSLLPETLNWFHLCKLFASVKLLVFFVSFFWSVKEHKPLRFLS